MLLDSASMYFRAFHGVPQTFTAPDGTPVNAVRGFLDMVATLITRRRPRRLVACWDEDWRPAFRVAVVPSYKTHRLADGSTNTEVVPPLLEVQVPLIIAGRAALGIARVGAPGHEADDVLGTLAARETADGAEHDVEIVSGDRDLLQLVDDGTGVRVLYIGKGVRNLEVADQAWLAAKYGVPTGPAYADVATLRGDPSDGLPGVPGVGEKTAVALINRFGSVEGLLAALDDPAATVASRPKLAAARGYLETAPSVVRVRRDAPVNDADDALPAAPRDPDALLALAERWDIDSSLARVVTALDKAAG
jgi:5'-3' exonuclease